MSSLRPRTHYERKKDVWRALFDGYYSMSEEVLEITARTLVSGALAILIYSGQVPGSLGAVCLTVIMGIDLAAAFEALRESQTESDRDVDYTSDHHD